MKALFVGLGSIGQRHLRNLRQLRGDSIEILATRSLRQVPMLDENRNVVTDGDISKHYGIREYSSLDEALSQRPDVVFVTNPSSLHLDTALEAASMGCHLFIEKPLHNSLDGVDELIGIVNERQLVATVAYQLRFHPGLRKVDEWLTDNRIGRIVSAQITHGEYLPNFHPYEDYRTSYAARRELGGGVLLTQIHEFDYVLWLFGKPRRLFSIGGKLSDLEVDVEDTASILMECGKGSESFPVTICLDYLQTPAYRFCLIVGTEGSIYLDFYGAKSAVLKSHDTKDNESFSFEMLHINELFLNELEEFLNAVERGATPIVDLSMGLESLEVALKAKSSMTSGLVEFLK